MQVPGPALHGLDSEEQAELERILQSQRRHQARAANRSQLLRTRGDIIRISAHIHLLEVDHETQIRDQLEALNDKIAVLQHCRPDHEDAAGALLTTSLEQRSHLAKRLNDGCRTVHLQLAQRPFDGQQPTFTDLPVKLVRRARELSIEVERAAIRVVEDIVDSELLHLVRKWSNDLDPPAMFRCADPSSETAERVIAFVDEIARLGAIRDAAAERLRFEALQRSSRGSSSRTASQAVRAAQAREAMDSLRALHAAIAEVELACRS